MASLVCAIPVSYFGSRSDASKPRWIGWGVFIMGLGSFIFAIPHFSSSQYEGGDSMTDFLTCLRGKSSEARCNLLVDNQFSSFKYIFIMAQLLHGVGASPLYTLGVTFLDESVPVRMSSVYLGIFFAMAVIGPAAGFVLGGQFLKIYIDAPDYPEKAGGIQESSDLWLGAWWIGFILSGAISMVISWPLMAFPSALPGAKALALERESEAYGGKGSTHSTSNAFGRLCDLPGASKILAGNPTFVALSLAGATEGTLLAGFATFMPKFIESQFSIQASFAAIIVGFIAVPAGGGGTLIGGWLIKKLNLKCAGILKFCIGFSFLCLLSCFTFFISCPNLKFAGVNTSYENRSSSPPSVVNLIAPCNKDCGCQDVSFDPVCGVNGITYFSPCHAGCTLSGSVKAMKYYRECGCLPFEDAQEVNITDGTKFVDTVLLEALGGTCPYNCQHIFIFLCGSGIFMFFMFILEIPTLQSTLRCVPATHRSFALGLQWIVVRLLGTIPGPILFGALIDNTCMLWQENCGKKGSCRTYDNFYMSRYMMSISIVAKTLSTILFFTSWWFYVPPQEQASEEAEGVVSPEHAKEFQGHDNPALEM
ncbi:solute carrier organic anion transporter family member 4A1-like isoform X2 [Oratosquilla oratoria]|uniref:solute carrier organic anion transporter family member 4A1-like isoform X2 n=1 Tax=Oratosquilla oratoria TaxID=337810 RepID=UPI003F76BB95